MTAAVRRGEPGAHFTNHNDSQALATSGVIKATPGTFFEVNGYNASGSTRYFHLYNSATVPGDGAVPACLPVVIPPSGVFSLSFSAGLFLDTGISWASSSSLATKTITGADLWVTITYK